MRNIHINIITQIIHIPRNIKPKSPPLNHQRHLNNLYIIHLCTNTIHPIRRGRHQNLFSPGCSGRARPARRQHIRISRSSTPSLPTPNTNLSLGLPVWNSLRGRRVAMRVLRVLGRGSDGGRMIQSRRMSLFMEK